jgi:outer membrane lipoprotein-sorting protein
MPRTKIALLLATTAFLTFTTFTAGSKAQDNQENELDPSIPLEPLRPGIAADQIFAELVARNEARNAALRDYTALRTYQVTDLKGKVHAEEIGRMEYHAPDKKTFLVTSEAGSGLIRHMALNPLIASEIAAAAGKEHRDSSITPANYTIDLLGEQEVGPYRCFVAQVIPRRKDKYLFEGKAWIDARDYAVVRIEGHPAKKLSFWIERADFVRQYQKIGGFWLPQRDETFVQVRLYGKNVLTIDHQGYAVNPAIDKYEDVQNVGNF